MKIECHILQNFAPSCLNRDDTNTPKECEFGGVRRARISSQSFKRAIREHFRSSLQMPSGNEKTLEDLKNLRGERTKAIKNQLVERLGESRADDAQAFIKRFLSDFDEKANRTDETEVLLFVSQHEIDAMVACITEGIIDKKVVAERIRNAKPSLDIALFGRMLANKNATNKEHSDRIQLGTRETDHASCQVAHALSTHPTELEMDFFTAVDDLNPRDDVGAGMLGYVGYSSACLYRYALLDTEQLKTNLQGDAALTKQGVEAFLWAFCDAEPSARQNGMPAHNRPSLVLFVAREKGVPTSLANAFCKPVSTRSQGRVEADLIGDSIRKFAGYHARLDSVYEVFSGAGATQALFHDQESAEALGNLAAHDAGSQRKAIEKILGVF